MIREPPPNPRMQPTNAGRAAGAAQEPASGWRTKEALICQWSFAADAHFVRQLGLERGVTVCRKGGICSELQDQAAWSSDFLLAAPSWIRDASRE
jgi:hypothetical protein